MGTSMSLWIRARRKQSRTATGPVLAGVMPAFGHTPRPAAHGRLPLPGTTCGCAIRPASLTRPVAEEIADDERGRRHWIGELRRSGLTLRVGEPDTGT